MTSQPAAASIPVNRFTPKAPAAARVIETRRLTPAHSANDVRHLVLDLGDQDLPYLEGQSVGVLTPGTDELGRPFKLRLYSVASPRGGDLPGRRTVSLCVKRVVMPRAEGGEHRGPASNYLCDLSEGDEVLLTGPVGKVFLLPDSPGINLIMIATGTGIAPFRAFYRAFDLACAPRPAHQELFFGVQYRQDVLYADELEAYGRQSGVKVSLAISREEQTAEGRRMYVQDRIREAGDRLWSLLTQSETHVYVCGLKGMEEGVREAFRAIARHHGADWDPFETRMAQERRFHVETY